MTWNSQCCTSVFKRQPNPLLGFTTALNLTSLCKNVIFLLEIPAYPTLDIRLRDPQTCWLVSGSNMCCRAALTSQTPVSAVRHFQPYCCFSCYLVCCTLYLQCKYSSVLVSALVPELCLTQTLDVGREGNVIICKQAPISEYSIFTSRLIDKGRWGSFSLSEQPLLYRRKKKNLIYRHNFPGNLAAQRVESAVWAYWTRASVHLRFCKVTQRQTEFHLERKKTAWLMNALTKRINRLTFQGSILWIYKRKCVGCCSVFTAWMDMRTDRTCSIWKVPRDNFCFNLYIKYKWNWIEHVISFLQNTVAIQCDYYHMNLEELPLKWILVSLPHNWSTLITAFRKFFQQLFSKIILFWSHGITSQCSVLECGAIVKQTDKNNRKHCVLRQVQVDIVIVKFLSLLKKRTSQDKAPPAEDNLTLSSVSIMTLCCINFW